MPQFFPIARLFPSIEIFNWQTLESAINEQAEREAKYQKEFETERTLSSQRELQMLEDFEWKLRETERNARKKIELAEAEATKRIQNMEMRLARAESDLERVCSILYLKDKKKKKKLFAITINCGN